MADALNHVLIPNDCRTWVRLQSLLAGVRHTHDCGEVMMGEADAERLWEILHEEGYDCDLGVYNP